MISEKQKKKVYDEKSKWISFAKKGQDHAGPGDLSWRSDMI